LKRFVAEEGRHARILGLLVKELGGTLMRRSWTERLFVMGRRLVGVRLKLLVLLAAEVVGIAYYGAVAEKVPPGSLRDALKQICGDEEAHLRFHVDFFRAECGVGWKRAVFMPTWWTVCMLAAVLVLHDHAPAMRTLGIERRWLAHRFVQLTREVAAAARVQPAGTPRRRDHQTYVPHSHHS
jgi:hypothetical protein